MKIETTMKGLFEGLTAEDYSTLWQFLPIDNSMDTGSCFVLDLEHILNDGGVECFLIALQCAYGDMATAGRAIAADIALIAIPVVAAVDATAALHAIGAIQAGSWYAQGKVDEEYMGKECLSVINMRDSFIDKLATSGAYDALGAAIFACYDGTDEENPGFPIMTYRNTLRAVACHNKKYLKAANIFDVCNEAAFDCSGIYDASKKYLEPLIKDITVDVKRELESRVDFIIRSHLGW